MPPRARAGTRDRIPGEGAGRRQGRLDPGPHLRLRGVARRRAAGGVSPFAEGSGRPRRGRRPRRISARFPERRGFPRDLPDGRLSIALDADCLSRAGRSECPRRIRILGFRARRREVAHQAAGGESLLRDRGSHQGQGRQEGVEPPRDPVGGGRTGRRGASRVFCLVRAAPAVYGFGRCARGLPLRALLRRARRVPVSGIARGGARTGDCAASGK